MSFEVLFGRHNQHDHDIATLVQLVLALTHQVCSLTAKVDKVMSDQVQLAAAMTAVATQLGEFQTELQNDVASLQQALANQGGTSPEVDAALAALTTRANSLGTQVQAVDALANPTAAPAPTV